MGISKIGPEKKVSGRRDDDSNEIEDSARSGTRLAPSFSERIDAALAANARVEAALDATSKTEAALADVFRTTKFLTATVTAVREANAAVTRELESLCSTVDRAGEDRARAVGRIQTNDHVRDDAGHDAERARLIAEHDRFIAMLLADHERELEALRRRFAEIESSKEPTHSASSKLPSK